MPKARQGGATPEKGLALREIALGRWSGAKKQWIVFSQYASICMAFVLLLGSWFHACCDLCCDSHMQLAIAGAAGAAGVTVW